MEKGCKNHRETLYSSKGKIVYYVVGKPCNIYRLQGKPYDNYMISSQSVNKKESCKAPFLRKTMFEHIFWLSNFISDTPWTSVLTLHSSTQNQRQGWYWLTSKIGIVQKYPLLEWAVSISKMQSSFPSRGEVKSKLWKTPFWRFIINCIHLSFTW